VREVKNDGQPTPLNAPILKRRTACDGEFNTYAGERDDTVLFVLCKKTGGEMVEKIRRTKIKEAMKETLNVYEKLDLNMTEIEIVSRSQNVAAKVTIAKKQLETEAEERLEEQQTPMKTKIIKWMPAICSTLAIVLSIISLVLRLYR